MDNGSLPMDLTNNGSKNNGNTDELLRAQTLLWSHAFNYIDSMSLKCAVELGIPQAIHNHKNPITISELLCSLSISPSKAPIMCRLMRMLTHSGIFAQGGNDVNVDDDSEVVYSLTPLSSLLVEDFDLNLNGFVLSAIHPFSVNPFQSMSAWFKSSNNERAPFSYMHGFSLFEMTQRDPVYNKVFNNAMASDTKFVMDALIKECGHVFDRVASLVDVGGGTGSAARAISQAFPNVKCSVLDLPHVVNNFNDGEDKSDVEFICGDMFEYIPPADAIFLKWVLHDWNDEECVKILKRCKEAINSCNNGSGKVIILDLVMEPNNCNKKLSEAQLYWDMMMMASCGGAERSEKEWRKIFIDAGYKNYKITAVLGLRSVIELYPLRGCLAKSGIIL